MAVTNLDIANMALGVLDEAQIASFTEDSRAARLMTLHYDQTVEAELSKYVWSFATLSSELTAFDVGGDGNRYQYEIPSDALRVLPITHRGLPVSWEQRDGAIYCAYEGPLTIRYVGRLTDPNDWNALFTDVVIGALALKLAHPITHKSGMVEMANSIYRTALQAALRANAIERAGQAYLTSWAYQRGDNRPWRV